MPWDEEELRRALREAAGRARPRPDALARLLGRRRRQERVRGIATGATALAAVVAVAFLATNLRPERPGDVLLGEPDLGGDAVASAPAFRRGTPLPRPPSPGPRPDRQAAEQANAGSVVSSISGDGRFGVFTSDASNLLPGDTNGVSDVFVRDFERGATIRVSVSSSGDQGNGSSRQPDVSADGRYVVFTSDASNLVRGDANGVADVFRHDRRTGSTVRLSVSSLGTEANGGSHTPSISADGQIVAFRSLASDLVDGDTNGAADIFVRDVAAEATTRVSVSTLGAQADGASERPFISADGRAVAFGSEASNLVLGDTNGVADVFVRDLAAGTTLRGSVSSSGEPGSAASVLPSLSADGRLLAFVSQASNLVPGDSTTCRAADGGARSCLDAFVHDLRTGVTSRVSLSSSGEEANGDTFSASVSADGRFVAFSSEASNLVPGDTNRRRDVFVHDRETGTTRQVSVSSDGVQGNGDSGGPSISDDGRRVVFQSLATNLVRGDTNRRRDVFVHDRATGRTGRISAPSRRR